MTFLELIDKKKKGIELSTDEYFYFINSLINKQIPDYQAAAFLMAIYINGMSDEELFSLIKAMIDTSEIVSPIANNSLKISIDKHSSGGVGDKVSLILSPILAALGYDVVKLSGRGLSFTGGTIDKLESIGISYEYNSKTFQNDLDKTNIVLMLQTDNIVPADKILYALRNVTGTVDSFPLIAASIMSKKLVVKTDYIFLDIKVGEGAFLKTLDEAKQFSELILKISRKFNRKTFIYLTRMSQPLGRAIGNAIEVKETIDFLQNKFHSQNLKDLIFQFCADILVKTNVCSNEAEAIKKVTAVIENNQAYEKFINYAQAFGSGNSAITNGTFFNPKYELKIYAKQSGFLSFKKVSEIGFIANSLGAGRFKKGDEIDYHSGIKLHFDPNQYVNENDIIATLYSSNPISNDIEQRFLDNLIFHEQEPKLEQIIIEKIQ